jgi:hypothetical protein
MNEIEIVRKDIVSSGNPPPAHTWVDESEQGLNETPAKIKIKFRLICASKCKKFALELARNQIRTKGHTRVSEEFLISCEVALKNHIISRVKMQPTRGKTLT